MRKSGEDTFRTPSTPIRRTGRAVCPATSGGHIMRHRSFLALALTLFPVPALALAGGVVAPKAVALAKLRGVNEVPSVITDASGDFTAKVFADHVDFTLSFSGLTGSTLFAHIH